MIRKFFTLLSFIVIATHSTTSAVSRNTPADNPIDSATPYIRATAYLYATDALLPMLDTAGMEIKMTDGMDFGNLIKLLLCAS